MQAIERERVKRQSINGKKVYEEMDMAEREREREASENNTRQFFLQSMYVFLLDFIKNYNLKKRKKLKKSIRERIER